jgi:hypothetical protein
MSREQNPTTLMPVSAAAAALSVAGALVLMRLGVSPTAAVLAGGAVAVLGALCAARTRRSQSTDVVLATLATAVLYLLLWVVLVLLRIVVAGWATP